MSPAEAGDSRVQADLTRVRLLVAYDGSGLHGFWPHEGVTTEAKAKSLRPVAEKMITKAKKGGLHNHRQVIAYLNDKEVTAKLFDEVGPRYADRQGGYTRILKLGRRHGDNAPMARIELV